MTFREFLQTERALHLLLLALWPAVVLLAYFGGGEWVRIMFLAPACLAGVAWGMHRSFKKQAERAAENAGGNA